MFVEVSPTRLKIDGTKTYCYAASEAPYPEKTNTLLFTLPAGKRSEYDWDEWIEEAVEKGREGYRILWELAFDEDPKETRDLLYQPLIEHSVVHFTETVYPHVKRFSVGVILGRYTQDWMHSHSLSASEEGEFLEHSEYSSVQEAKCSKLGALQVARHMNELLAADLQRAAARLPLELPAFVIFEQSTPLSSLELAYILSPTVFEFVHPIYTSQSILPFFGNQSMGMAGSLGDSFTVEPKIPDTGILLPPFELLTDAFLAELEVALEALPKPLRLLPEEKVVEMWEELETLVYFKGMLSNVGSRALQGFFAAGGTVTEYAPL